MSRDSYRKKLQDRLKEAEITPELPCVIGPANRVPSGLVGSTITAIGSMAGENSGLAIECRDEAGICHRVLLGFGDEGMAVSAIARI